MTLKTRFELNKEIHNAVFIEILKDPNYLFGNSKFVKKINVSRDSVEIQFEWTKMHMTRRFKVIAKIFTSEYSILYTSKPESPYEFKLSIDLYKQDGENSKIYVEAEMGAGLLADLMGKKDFDEFILNLINDAYERYMSYKPLELPEKMAGKDSGNPESIKSKATDSNENRFDELDPFLPRELIDVMNREYWEKANNLVTDMLSRNLQDLNLWIVKSFVCEKLNRKDLAQKYVNYIIEKDPNVLESEIYQILAKYSDMLRILENGKTTSR